MAKYIKVKLKEEGFPVILEKDRMGDLSHLTILEESDCVYDLIGRGSYAKVNENFYKVVEFLIDHILLEDGKTCYYEAVDSYYMKINQGALKDEMILLYKE